MCMMEERLTIHQCFLLCFIKKDAHIAIVPGDGFGLEGYFRMSFALSKEILIEACHRLEKSVNKLTNN